MADKIFGKDTVASVNEVKDASVQINKLLNDIDLNDLSQEMKSVAKASKDMSNELSESIKYSKDNKNLAKDQSKAALLGVKYATSRNRVTKLFRGLQIKMLGSQDEFTDGLKESITDFENIKQGASSLFESLKSGASEIDGVFENMGATIGGFITNPLSIATALLLTFNSQQETIANQFGAIGVTEFRQELAGASQEFVNLGLSASEAQSTISDLANNFGLGVSQAAAIADEVADLAISTGTSVADSAILVGLLTKTQGLTSEQAMNLSKSAVSLADANDVAPDKVLSDVANNTEAFAKFARDGGRNVLRAAVQARKLGIELSTVANAAEGFLDFESSINAELEASIMLGRNLNLQRARELSLAGDLEGLQQEIIKNVGSEAEFNQLNTLQRQSLAKALGMNVSEIQKLVSAEKEAVTLSGALSMAASETIIPEKTLTATAQLINDLKVAGMQLAEDIGPTLNNLVKGVVSFVSGFDKAIGIIPTLKGLLAGMLVKNIANAIASAATAYFTSAGKLPGPLGLAAIAAAPLALGGLAGLITGVASAQEGGITTQEGLVNVHPQEAIVPIEQLGGMINTAMTPVKDEISMLRQEMKSYFGFGGSVASNVGKSVASNLVG